METEMNAVTIKIMHSYINTMNEMEKTYNQRIFDLINQKQICQQQINDLFYQQYVKYILN